MSGRENGRKVTEPATDAIRAYILGVITMAIHNGLGERAMQVSEVNPGRGQMVFTGSSGRSWRITLEEVHVPGDQDG